MRSTLPTFNEVWQRQFRSTVLKQQQQFKKHHFLIGCSGGMDSMLLLHVMSALFPQRIRAIYIDHQLQAISSAWGNFVEDECRTLDIPVTIQPVSVAQGNLEQKARDARYAAFRQHLQSNEVLVLAHHEQDQAETLLLRLFSGSGVQGLSAMQAIDVREDLTIWRPLLNISREQIQAWVNELQIAYITDPTNSDTHYDRAWCRETLWPVLNSRFPKMQQAICRTSQLMQDANEILAEVLNQDLMHCGDADMLEIEKLQQLSQARQRQLLSAWMKGQAQYRPSFDMVQRLQNEVITSKADSQAALHCQGYYYLRYQKQLFRLAADVYLNKQQPIQACQIQFSLAQAFDVASGRFRVQKANHVGLSDELLQQALDLAPRLGGEKIHLYGRVGTWPLKKAIQDAQIYPWRRHTIQILSIDNVMLGVFTPQGFWLADSPYCVEGGWLPHLVSEFTSI